MLVTIEQSRLLKILQIVERAVNDRSALPILANILFEVRANELMVTATDLDVGVQCRLPLSGRAEPGSITLPARRIGAIVKELPDEPVVVEAKKNHTAHLSCGTSQFRLPGLPAEDFPTFPVTEHASSITMPSLMLKTLINRTAFAMSMEETRFVLNGALLQCRPDGVTLVATDGRRLAVAKSPQTLTLDNPVQAVVPSKTIRELGRLLPDEAEAVTITPLKEQQLLFHFEGVTLISRLIDGQFPPYESVIPPPVKTHMIADRQGLMNAVRRASLMTTATSQAVVFELAHNRMTVLKESPELGSAREELTVTYQGEPMAIAFNPDFWLDVLKILDTADVAIELSSPEKPAVIRDQEFLYLVLPMKLA